MEIPKTREEIEALINKSREEADDMELAMFLHNHIENPCEAEISPGKFENIRHIYINEAKRVLEKLKNPFAKKMLEDMIKKYTK
ncbi:MAG: hypothetical protein A3J76_04655 [Candidatus Moranbacteria bacterium RBG_13_45_13]|nr:MAG: hypothetical protein A3J76_04655 [Candidatus Moranbacteria bacterium RBG_13_45_13]